MKSLLIDYIAPIQADLVIVEGVGNSGRMRLRGKLQEVNTLNGNGRVYRKDTLEREINKFIENCISINNALGELDHADDSIVHLNNVSHNIKKIWWDGNVVMGELELLETPSGRIAKELVAAGIPLGISSRGMGSVKQVGESVEVQDDFDLLTWDLVSTPSTPNAYMKLSEGKEYKENEYSKINNIITDILCSRGNVCSCITK